MGKVTVYLGLTAVLTVCMSVYLYTTTHDHVFSGWMDPLLGLLKVSAIVVSVCMFFLCVFLYTPLPGEFDEPWKLRMLLAMMKLFNYITRIMCLYYNESNLSIQRRLFTKRAKKNMTSPHDPLLKTTDTEFDGTPVRIYRLKAAKSPCPAMMYFHGGGWTLGSADFMDRYTHKLTTDTGMVIVSVNYRLAPEYPYPIPFQDSLKATTHLLRNAGEYGVDPHKIMVAGDSAGGNLAAAVALYLKDNTTLPKLFCQVLIYPCIQPLNFRLPSWSNPRNYHILTPTWMVEFWLNYFGIPLDDKTTNTMLKNQHTPSDIKKSRYAERASAKLIPTEFKQDVKSYGNSDDEEKVDENLWKKLEKKAFDPYMCPLLADDVTGLPPTFVLTGEYDILRDEGILYAERLRKAGVDVTLKDYKMIHGLAPFVTMFKVARKSTDDIEKFIFDHM